MQRAARAQNSLPRPSTVASWWCPQWPAAAHPMLLKIYRTRWCPMVLWFFWIWSQPFHVSRKQDEASWLHHVTRGPYGPWVPKSWLSTQFWWDLAWFTFPRLAVYVSARKSSVESWGARGLWKGPDIKVLFGVVWFGIAYRKLGLGWSEMTFNHIESSLIRSGHSISAIAAMISPLLSGSWFSDKHWCLKFGRFSTWHCQRPAFFLSWQ